MNKKQLVDALSTKQPKLTKVEISAFIDDLTETITTAVSNGSEVTLYGFGAFKASLQKGKSGKIPGSDKTYTTNDKMVPRFKASKAFKSAVASK